MLRALTLALPLAVLAFAPGALAPRALAQDQPADMDAANDAVEFAPGSTGRISPEIVEALRRAKREAAAMRDGLKLTGPVSLPDAEIRRIEAEALNNLRARTALGLDGEDAARDGARHADMRAALFLSFSIPPHMLEDLMRDASARDIPIVFRGFRGNSVQETRAALLAAFGSDEDIVGFAIDPTLFTQFDIRAVPTLVVLKETYAGCTTQACEGDVAPLHDKLAGTVRVTDALKIIASARGDAAEVAEALLEAGGGNG